MIDIMKYRCRKMKLENVPHIIEKAQGYIEPAIFKIGYKYRNLMAP